MQVRTVTRADADLFRHYQLTDDDRRFTAHPRDTLDDFSVDPDRRHYAVLLEEKPIGFFTLHAGPTITSFAYSDRSVLFRAFSIDHREQGKGYGKAALLAIIEDLKQLPDNHEIRLSCEPDNAVAERLYRAVGFAATGEIQDEEIVMRLER